MEVEPSIVKRSSNVTFVTVTEAPPAFSIKSFSTLVPPTTPTQIALTAEESIDNDLMLFVPEFTVPTVTAPPAVT